MSRRVVLLALTLICVGFALYGSLVPLRFRPIPFDEAVERFAQASYTPFSRASGSDFLTNVLLFVPVGFFGLGALSGRSRPAAVFLLVPASAMSVAASLGIEFAQTFTVGRTPSWNDVEAQLVGFVAGGLTWMAIGNPVVDWLSPFFRSESDSDRLYRLLGAYTGLWIILGLLPLDFTIRPQELASKFRGGRIILEPFSSQSTLREVGGTALMAVPIGVFGVLAGAARGWARPALVGLVAGLAITSGMELVQLLSVRRTADVTDVLMGALGVGVGVAIATRWRRPDEREASDSPVQLWPLAVLSIWTVLLIVRHWSPFDFVADGAFVRRRLPAMFGVPFASYYWGFAPSVLGDAITKILMGIPVGALLQLIWRPDHRGLRLIAAAAAVAISSGVFLVLELGQLLLPSRTPDQTDIYLGTLGAMAGVALAAFVLRRPVRQNRPAGDAASPSRLPADS